MPNSDNWTEEGSQMVSGNTGLKLPSLIASQHKTLASHGAEKQLTSKQGPSIDRGQHHMVKKEASRRQPAQQSVVKQRHSKTKSLPSPQAVVNLSKGQLETTPTSKTVETRPTK